MTSILFLDQSFCEVPKPPTLGEFPLIVEPGENKLVREVETIDPRVYLKSYAGDYSIGADPATNA